VSAHGNEVRVSRAECDECGEHASVTDFRFDSHPHATSARCEGSGRDATAALARQIRADLQELESAADREAEQLEALRKSLARRRAMVVGARKQLAVCERRVQR
jgi:hypothetical protein